MSSLPLLEWDSSLFSDLRHLFRRVTSQPTTSSLRNLYSKLEEAQPWILNLTQLPPPSNDDKAYIEKNPVTLPSGTSVPVTGDILNLTNAVSEALSLSQKLSARLVLQAEGQQHLYPSRTAAEVSVYILHQWQNDLLVFLRDLLDFTFQAEAGPLDALVDWTYGLLSSKVSLRAGGEGTLVDQILAQTDELQSKLDSLLRTGSQSYELTRFRLEATRAAQNQLGGILGLIAENGQLGRGQVIRVIKWLKKSERLDSTTGVVLSSLFAAWKPLESLDASDPRYDVAEDWCHDIKFLKLASSLTLQETWSNARSREAAKLSWALFYLSCIRHDPSVVQTGIDAHQMEQHLFEAVSGDAFELLHQLITNLRQDRGWDESEVSDELLRTASASNPDNDTFILAQLQHLVDTLSGRKNFLRTLRNKEEDLRRSQVAPAHYQRFLALAGVVYKSLPPDSAERLWDNTTFLGTVLDTRGGFPGTAFWSLLAAVSAGPTCAAKSYEKMKDTRLPWTALFKFYQHYIDIMPHIHEPIKASRNTSLDPMPHDEAEICRGWTEVLSTVIRWSPAARSALLQSKLHPLQSLFDLLNCENIPLDLKAAVLNTVTAFVDDSDEVISKAVECYERVTFRDPALDTRNLDAAKIPAPFGWLAKMEYSEQDASTYPLTRAYLAFLTALLRGKRHINTLRRGTFYAIDGVLLSLRDRRYARDSERWEVLDALTGFLDKALSLFDLSSLLSADTSAPAAALSEEAGFIITLRILSDSNVFAVLASILDNAATARRTPVINDVLLRILGIYHRIHDIQIIFVDILLLALSDPTRNAHPLRRPIGLQSLDNHLLAHLGNINAIALLVGDDQPAISLVSANIISALAQSPVFSRSDVFRGEYTSSVNRLAGIIDASDDSIRIAQGFSRRLASEGSSDDAGEVGADITNLPLASLPLAIRSVILDILIDGTASEVTTPNIAHFLLGYDFKTRDLALQDGQSCLHVVLRQLCDDDPSLITIHPVLAAKSAKLLYQLFSHPLTGRSTMSHAMAKDYTALQLALTPRRCPETDSSEGLAVTPDEEIPTTSDTLVSYLNFQRWIISSAALETFSYDGHGASAFNIAQTLFRASSDEETLPALLVDLLTSLDVQYIEPTDNERTLEFYATFPFDQYQAGEWFNLDDLKRGLANFRQQLERQGAVTSASISAMNAEAEYIAKRLSSKNKETEISLAKGTFLTAWNELLKVSLIMLFRHIAEEEQELVLFDLLDAILLRLDADLAPGIFEVLAEAVLVTVNALISVLAEIEGSNLPIDRLSSALSRIIDAATRPGSTETSRGNLYAAISQYLTVAPSLNVLSAKKERLLPTLCRDAMDDRDVWKTECFALLNGIVSLCQNDRHVLSPLIQNGYLPLFVRSIKEKEFALQACLSDTAENLHAYWVFEAKVAFLLSYASTRKGAEELLDAGIFEILSTCGFIDMQVEDDSEIALRQRRVLTCSLQLLARLLSSLHHSPRSGAGHALSFLNAHRETILSILRDSPRAIDEARLVISILGLVVHKVPKEDLLSPTSFGSFHLGVLAIAAHFFDKDNWAEMSSAAQLNQVVFVYLSAVTRDLKAGSGSPVFISGAQRISSRLAAAPSLQLAVDLLSDLTENIQEISNQYEAVIDRIQDGVELDEEDLENLRKVGAVVDVSEDIVAVVITTSQTIFSMIESLLLLLWRHLLFYANDARGDSIKPNDISASQILDVSRSTTGAGTIRVLERVSADLRGTLSRLDDIEINLDLRRLALTNAGANGSGEAYYNMLIRRLRELTAGITGDGAGNGSANGMEED